MDNGVKYEKIGETDIIQKNLPETQKEAEAWVGESHIFSLFTEDIKAGYFKLVVSSHLQSIPPVGISALAMKELAKRNPAVEIKMPDTYIEFQTIDTYNIQEDEKENHELVYELILKSIRTFNSLLQKNTTTFWMGRLFKEPSYESSLLQITDVLRNLK